MIQYRIMTDRQTDGYLSTADTALMYSIARVNGKNYFMLYRAFEN